MKTTGTPQMTILRSGKSFKVLQVTGSEGMSMPDHFSTKEAVLMIQIGSATLKINGEEHLLTKHQSFIIPTAEHHTLILKEKFQAIVIMEVDSEIKFVNS
jgi:quercetin dioxygenase-like cupin family protein